jgi:hypothetical protein
MEGRTGERNLCFVGAWGIGTFENDTALDWTGDFEDDPSITALEAAFETIAPGTYAESDACSSALAAAELVAWAKHAGLPDFEPGTKTVRFLAALKSADVARLAAVAASTVTRIGSESELQELWEESQENRPTAWHGVLAELRSRLTSP